MVSIMDYFRQGYANPLVAYGVDGAPIPQQEQSQDADFLSQLSGAGNAVPVSRMPISRAPIEPAFVPTSGSAMEAESRSSIDDLMAKLATAREEGRQADRNQQWMSFFSALANSKNPRLTGGLGEASAALADTTGKQSAQNRALDRADITDQLKVEQWKEELARKTAADAADAELKAAQAKYYTAGGSGAAGAGMGGSTGVLAQRYMQSMAEAGTPVTFPEALYAVQTGFRQGTTLKDGQVVPTTGATDAKSAEEASKGLGKKIGEGAGESLTAKRTAAEDANITLSSNSEARKLLNAGMITGTGADWIKGFGKAVHQAGFDYNDDPVANTEAYVAQRVGETARIIKAFGAGTGLSDADREYAAQAAAGRITLNESSIRKILDISDKAAKNSLIRYNTELKKVPESAKPYDIGVPMPSDVNSASPEAPTVRKFNPSTGRIE